jgi:hypothetical protein
LSVPKSPALGYWSVTLIHFMFLVGVWIRPLGYLDQRRASPSAVVKVVSVHAVAEAARVATAAAVGAALALLTAPSAVLA